MPCNSAVVVKKYAVFAMASDSSASSSAAEGKNSRAVSTMAMVGPTRTRCGLGD